MLALVDLTLALRTLWCHWECCGISSTYPLCSIEGKMSGHLNNQELSCQQGLWYA